MLRALLTLIIILALGYVALAFWPGPAPVSHPYFAAAPAGRAEVIAHGGGLGVRPANTLSALDAAARMGADVLEVDVQQTADGVLVLLHDATLDRTTDMTGAVADMPLETVRQADAGAGPVPSGGDFSGRGIGVPTLAAAFARHPQARWVLEIKPNTEEAAEAICREIRDAGAETRTLVGSFHDDAMAAFRKACPEVATSLSTGEVTLFALAAWAGLGHLVPTEGVALQIPTASSGITLAHPRIIKASHARGFKVQFWTINERAEMDRLIAMGADGLITDYVERGLTAVSPAR
ncbi:MAG: glycerophosphodiester phosphodiesterase [Alphaproteobacteria bacterium]